jgi:hypothetical protein
MDLCFEDVFIEQPTMNLLGQLRWETTNLRWTCDPPRLVSGEGCRGLEIEM